MARYIDADALREDLKESESRLRELYEGLKFAEDKQICAGQIITFFECILRIKEQPTAEVVEVRHGEWNRVRWVKCDDPDGGYWIVRCNQCSIPHFKEYKFCPSCGAKMDGGG